jgi:O-antigen ligase
VPWLFGGVLPAARHAIVPLGLGGAGLGLLLSARRGAPALPAIPLWPFAGLLLVGALQLVPMPLALLRLVAPASAAVWAPASEAARAVLGPGPRPVSIAPAATLLGLASLGAILGLALVAAPALAEGRRAERAAAAVVAGGVGLALFGVFAAARLGPRLYGLWEVPTTSPFGPFVSKNHFAGYTAMAALLALGLALGIARRHGSGWTRAKHAPAVVASAVAAAVMATSVLVARSRGGALALAGGAAAMALLLLRASPRSGRAGRLLPGVMVAVGVGAAVFAVLPDAVRERLVSGQDAAFRLAIWRDALLVGAAGPVAGHGLGSFGDALPRFKQGHGSLRVDHAENDYLELLAEAGLVGLALAVLAAAGTAWGAASRSRSVPSELSGLGAGALGGLGALAVHSLVDFSLRIPSNALLAAFLLAMAAATRGVRGPELSRRAAGVASGLALLSASAWSLFGVPAVTKPERAWLQAGAEAALARRAPAREVRELRVERAHAAAREAVSLRPAFAEGWLLLAALERERGGAEAARDLARHAAWLDPRRPELAAAAEALGR